MLHHQVHLRQLYTSFSYTIRHAYLKQLCMPSTSITCCLHSLACLSHVVSCYQPYLRQLTQSPTPLCCPLSLTCLAPHLPLSVQTGLSTVCIDRNSLRLPIYGVELAQVLKRSCEPVLEIMWSNTWDHVSQYWRSCEPMLEIMWPSTGDHVTQYWRSCDPILEIMWYMYVSYMATVCLHACSHILTSAVTKMNKLF